MNLILRLTTESDLPFVFEIERKAADDRFVTSETIENHRRYLGDSDIRHFVIEADEKAVGYAILAGLNDKNENIEFRRLVIAEKGKGYGRKVLHLIKKLAFEKLGAHRLWLDVKDFNERARKLYESENFTSEGIWREAVKAENGRRESIVFMSILRHEYLTK